MRLVWVDPATGTYIPQLRREFPCNTTWKGYPQWSLREVGHLINDSEHRQCRCRLHRGPSPFLVFAQREKPVDVLDDFPSDVDSPIGSALATPSDETESVPALDGTTPGEFNEDDQSLVTNLEVDVFPDCYSSCAGEAGTEGCSIEGRSGRQVARRRENGGRSGSMGSTGTVSILLSPTQTLTPGGSREEDSLFYHYVNNVSSWMLPVDVGRNPWKSTYPSLALQNLGSDSTRSLYHAILAQSSYHLSNLKGPSRGIRERTNAMRYFGMALRELRESLATPSEDYSSGLAALLTITLVEHVFRGKPDKPRNWRTHFQGAMVFVTQYLTQQPWMSSPDAWVVTQNFVLSMVLAHTAGRRSLSTMDSIANLYSVFSGVTRRTDFGYTIGGTARLIETIYKIRLLEEQILSAGCTNGIQAMNEDMLLQVEEISAKLRVPIDEEIEAFMHHGDPDDMVASTRTRMLIKLHFRLFNNAVIIYFSRTVLQYPPAAVAEYVWEVLTDTMAFGELQDAATVSLWPVFVAAAEACSPEAQELANNYMVRSEKLGAGNRQEAQRIVHQVWADREQLAAEWHCDPSQVCLDWRDVMRRLDWDVLLL